MRASFIADIKIKSVNERWRKQKKTLMTISAQNVEITATAAASSGFPPPQIAQAQPVHTDSENWK